MQIAKLRTRLTVDEYLEGENDGHVRHEFVGGEVYAMAGASDRHHRISANLLTALDTHLSNEKCEAFMVDMKLRTADDAFYYPDVFVACDDPPPDAYFRQIPVLIIEVLSPSTRHIDRREKLRAYQLIPSVREYVVIDQDKIYVELHRRQRDGRWITYFYNSSDRDIEIEFESVGLKTTLADVYRRVRFAPTDESELEQ